MTTPDTPTPDDPFPRELLAAYADGELDAPARAAVERWLADHPEAAPELQAQRDLSPANAGLWERAEPPEPSPVAWACVRRGIAAALAPAEPAPAARGGWRNAAWAAAAVAVAGVAAAAAWVFLAPAPPADRADPIPTANGGAEVAPHPRAVEEEVLVAGFAVLPIATDEDVILERVPATEALLPVGRHPLPPVLLLASADDVELEEVAPSPLWPTGMPKIMTAPGDAPMIYAAKPR